MIKFYWYEKCSTCKRAKAWLDQHQIDYQLIDLINDTPTKEQFVKWMEETEIPIHKFFNTSGIIYRKENLKEVVYSLSKEEAAEKLSERGMLVKRPILENGKQLFLGFKEAEYETLL